MVVVELVVVVVLDLVVDLAVVMVLAVVVVELVVVVVLAVVMVLALVVYLVVVMDKDKVVIEECLDTSMDHFRMLLTNYNVSIYIFSICSCCPYSLICCDVHVLQFVLIVITN